MTSLAPLVGTVTVVNRPSSDDVRGDGRSAGGRGDVTDVLHVLPVADQVLAGLELLDQLGRHRRR